jgi:hypothetical protein
VVAVLSAWHVGNRESLLDALVERTFADLGEIRPIGRTPAQRIASAAGALRTQPRTRPAQHPGEEERRGARTADEDPALARAPARPINSEKVFTASVKTLVTGLLATPRPTRRA